MALTIPDSVAGVADLFRPFARVAVSRDGDAFVAVSSTTDTRTALAVLPRERPVVLGHRGRTVAAIGERWGALAWPLVGEPGDRTVRVYGEPDSSALPHVFAFVSARRARYVWAPEGPFARALRAVGLHIRSALQWVDSNDETFWVRLFAGAGVRALRGVGMLSQTGVAGEPVERPVEALYRTLECLADWGLPPPRVEGLRGLDAFCAMLAGAEPRFPERVSGFARGDLLAALLAHLDRLGHACDVVEVGGAVWTAGWVESPAIAPLALALRIRGRPRDPGHSPVTSFGTDWIAHAHRADLAAALRASYLDVEQQRKVRRNTFAARYIVPARALSTFYADIAALFDPGGRRDGRYGPLALSKATLAVERPPVRRGWTRLVGEPPEVRGAQEFWP